MEIFVEGTMITLTTEQEEKIKKERRKRNRYRNNFKKILKHLGFKQVKGQPNSFEHPAMGWYAEINDNGAWSDVWMTGKGLKNSSGMPGGWTYGSAEEIEKEILNTL